MARQPGTRQTREAMRAVDRIRPLLAGRPSEMQGLIVADLVAIWLAGHAADTVVNTALVRSQLFAVHLAQVIDGTAINAKIIGTRAGEPRVPTKSEVMAIRRRLKTARDNDDDAEA